MLSRGKRCPAPGELMMSVTCKRY